MVKVYYKPGVHNQYADALSEGHNYHYNDNLSREALSLNNSLCAFMYILVSSR